MKMRDRKTRQIFEKIDVFHTAEDGLPSVARHEQNTRPASPMGQGYAGHHPLLTTLPHVEREGMVGPVGFEPTTKGL